MGMKNKKPPLWFDDTTPLQDPLWIKKTPDTITKKAPLLYTGLTFKERFQQIIFLLLVTTCIHGLAFYFSGIHTAIDQNQKNYD